MSIKQSCGVNGEAINIQPDQIINLLGAIVGAILAAIISAFAVMFYGERWVETSRKRREHSIKLKDEVLKPWLSKVEEYCKIGVAYSYDVHKIVGVEPKDPTDLEFFDVAHSHLESKYPNIIKAWEELKHVTSELNKDLASFLEEIRTLTIKELNMPCYYSDMRGRSPEEYITIDRFVETVYEEIKHRMYIRTEARAEHRVHPERKWMIGEPRIEPVVYGQKKCYELEWGSYRLVKTLNEKEAEKARKLIEEIINNSKIQEQVKDLIRREETNFKMKRESFEGKIKEVTKSIELGNVLRGKCQFCP